MRMATMKICLVLAIIPVCLCQPFNPSGELKFLRKNATVASTLNLDLFKLFAVFNIEEIMASAKPGQGYNLLSGFCMSDSETIVAGLKSNNTELKTIALKFIDAASKIPHGILQGNSLWVGDYEECLSLGSLDNPQTGKSFSGKYFTVSIVIRNSPLPMIKFGICLPDSCTEGDAVDLMNLALLYIKSHEPAIAGIDATATSAHTRENNEIKGGVIATIVISVLILLLVVMGTLLGLLFPTQTGQKHVQDNTIEQSNLIESTPSEKTYLLEDDGQFRHPKRKQRVVIHVIADLIKTFSFLDNARKLFGTDTAHGPLACINCLRVVSMWWVILGHTYEFATGVVDNPIPTVRITERFSFQPVINGTLSVDTFFFLSGLLVAYIAFKEIRERGKINWIYFFVHRYWRLTPLYAFVILFFANMAKLLLYGPFELEPSQMQILDSCKTYWWTNLLYINNMYPNYGSLDNTCLAWGWYLANDMQFYIFLSPIVILLLWRVRKIGILVTCFLILGCIFSRGFIYIYFGMHGPDSIVTKHTTNPWRISATYVRPYTRWSVYLVGMLTGYLLSVRSLRINMAKVIAFAGWCAAIAIAIAVVFGQYYYLSHPGTEMTMTTSVFYYSLYRTAWGICLAWVVLACVAGKGGPVKHILSWTIWAPLGRLTYAAYLVHPIILIVFFYNLQTPLHYTDLTTVYIYIGNIVMTYGIAFVVSMLVEAPMIQLEKAILKMFKTKA